MMKRCLPKRLSFIWVLSILTILFSYAVQIADQKPIVVVTCMYNNEQWVLHNLNSIFMQEYSNFRVIIVDDGSQDRTASIIQDYIDQHGFSDRVTFIENNSRKRKLANLYHVLYLCDDNEIVIMLDGDDWFAHEKVFKKINETYADPEVWLTYGQYYNVPPEEAIKWGYSPKGYATEMPKEQQDKHQYRSGPFRFMHLRTFYGWLFKIIRLEDLLSETVAGFKGAPFPASNDLAMYYPMIETAHYRIRFISEILYIRNLFSDIVGFKVDRKIQRASAQEIRRKKEYPVLHNPMHRNLERYLDQPIAVMMLCDKNVELVEQIFKSLTSVQNGFAEFYLVCHYSIDKGLVDRLEKEFNIKTALFHYTDEKSLSTVLQSLLNQLNREHIMFVTSTYQQRWLLDYQTIAYWLEKTYARSFHTGLQSGLAPTQSWLVPLNEVVCAWKICLGRGPWRFANPLNGVMYRTKDVQAFLVDSVVRNVAQLTLLFKKELYGRQSGINLCYC